MIPPLTWAMMQVTELGRASATAWAPSPAPSSAPPWASSAPASAAPSASPRRASGAWQAWPARQSMASPASLAPLVAAFLVDGELPFFPNVYVCVFINIAPKIK